MTESTEVTTAHKLTPDRFPETMRIFVVAHHDIYVDGLLQVINALPGHEVVECASPSNRCYDNFTRNPAEILLVEQSVVEAHLQSTTIDELFREFQQNFPALRIIIFGRQIEDDFVRKLIRAGAHGFIDSTMTKETLESAIHEVHSGGYWVSRKALEEIIYSAVEMERIVEQNIRDKVAVIKDDLTQRESDALQCVLEGLSTREIAGKLCLSEQSVKLHLGRLFRKFEVTNRSQLILMAFARVCPVNNMIKLFRSGLDKKRLRDGKPPLIPDPLNETA
jgi:DNA-binding NarL/FixJ family response regulator